MDPTRLTLTIAILAAALLAAVCWRWNVVQDRQTLWAVTRTVLSTRRFALIGTAGALAYLAFYFILGGRVVYFYERLLFNVTASGVLLALLSAFLIAILLALFAYTLATLGMLESKKGSWGIAGVLLAMVVSFCP